MAKGCSTPPMYPSTYVAHVLPLSVTATPRFHPLLVESSGHYCARLKPCGLRKPDQKGNVERLNRFIRERFLAGQYELLTFLDEIAFARPHPAQRGRTVRECFEQGRTRLLPLSKAPVAADQGLPARVDKTASCRFDTTLSSVAPDDVGKTLVVAADDLQFRLHEGSSLFALHPRCVSRHRLIEEPQLPATGVDTVGLSDRDLREVEARGLEPLLATDGRSMTRSPTPPEADRKRT